jgi:hypothetical protein
VRQTPEFPYLSGASTIFPFREIYSTVETIPIRGSGHATETTQFKLLMRLRNRYGFTYTILLGEGP